MVRTNAPTSCAAESSPKLRGGSPTAVEPKGHAVIKSHRSYRAIGYSHGIQNYQRRSVPLRLEDGCQ